MLNVKKKVHWRGDGRSRRNGPKTADFSGGIFEPKNGGFQELKDRLERPCLWLKRCVDQGCGWNINFNFTNFTASENRHFFGTVDRYHSEPI